MSAPRSRRRRLVLTLSALGLCPWPLLAADVSWTNPAGGSFAVAGNWSGGPPGNADTAIFNLNTAGYTVTFSANVSNQQFRVGSDTVTLDLAGRNYNITTGGTGYALQVGTASGQTGRLTVSGGTLTATNAVFGNAAGAIGHGTLSTGARWTNNGTITIGESGSGSFTIFGTMTSNIARIGRQAGASGTLIVDGPSASYSTPGVGLLVGSIGNGTFLIRNGADFSDQGSFISGFGGAGYAAIDGAGSTWTSVDGLYVGNQGPGTLSITNGGRFVQTGNAFSTGIGVLGGSSGTLSVSGAGSAVELAAQLSVGNDGTGRLFVSGGGTILSDRATGNIHGYIGEGTTGIGTVILSDASTKWSGDGAVAVGYLGRGTLNINNGATVEAAQGWVAAFGSARGTAVVDGGNWTVTQGLYVGGDSLFAGGLGSLSFGSGGSVNAGATLKVWSTGTVSWNNGGTLSANSVAILGLMQLQPGRDKVLRTQALDVDTSTSGRLDLADNAAIVDYPSGGPSPLTAIRADLVSGRAGGAWNGTGIQSSTVAAGAGTMAIGYAEAGDLFTTFPATFLGQSVDSTSVLVRATLLGDANLDGAVGIADFARLGAAYNLPGGWSAGDFNYDGLTGIADFSLLAANFNQSLPPAGVPARGAPIPEPATLLLPLAALALRRRRG